MNQPWYQSEVLGRCLVRKQPDVTGYTDAAWHDFVPVVFDGQLILLCRFCAETYDDLRDRQRQIEQERIEE